MRLLVGVSGAADARHAATDAARQALAVAAEAVFAFVYATPGCDADVVAEAVAQELDHVPWAGCVTPAILTEAGVMDHGVAVGVVDSPGLRVCVGAASGAAKDPADAGRRAARDAVAASPLPPADRSRAIILFAAGVQAAEAVHGALGVAGAGVVWTGGGVGDEDSGARIFAHGRALCDNVVVICLDADARVGAGTQHGWEPIGAPAMVTRASGPVVEYLEHRPALEIYRAAADGREEGLAGEAFEAFAMTHPLGIPQAGGEYLIRDPIAVEPNGALRFMASLPDGALVRVMTGTSEMLVDAARVAASTARGDAGGPLGGALVFDCISRYSILGARLGEELAVCRGALGEEVPILGCLTFGEVGAFGLRMPQFHNKTIVVLALPS